MRYVFIINPAAGKNNSYLGIVPKIEEYFKSNKGEYKILFSSKKGDALSKARAEAQTGDDVMIFACGGEGTCFEVLNGVAGYDNVTISEIPLGSANDFLKSFGTMYKSYFLNIDELINGVTIEVDAVKANEYYCINGCSVGMDAVVARDMAIFKNWPFVSGEFAYKLAVVKNFFKKIGAKLQISIDGKHTYTKNCLFAVVGNGPVYGGGYYATPKALPYDQILDYTVVEKISRFKILRFLKRYERGQHENLPFCDMGKCSLLEIVCEKSIPVNLDGEIIECSSVRVEICKKFIKFRVPREVAEKINDNLHILTKYT